VLHASDNEPASAKGLTPIYLVCRPICPSEISPPRVTWVLSVMEMEVEKRLKKKGCVDFRGALLYETHGLSHSPVTFSRALFHIVVF
jgi:hypothetical protein